MAVLALALAGCGEDPPSEDEVEVAPTDDALSTGVLRGVVVDEAIRPLADAVVSIRKDGHAIVEVATDADGNFGVQSLESGAYTVNASKPGYLSAEAPATVVGGDNLPPIVQIQLALAPADLSFVWPIVWNGQVACGVTPQNWCAGINLATGIDVFNDQSFKFLFDEFMAYERTPDFLQAEFIWEPNTALPSYAFAATWASTWQEWEECLCTPNLFATEGGSGKILLQADRATFEELDVGFSRGLGVGFSVGTGEDENLQDPSTYSVMVNQPFEGFFHVFYGCLPEEGWLFTEHGEPTCDPKRLEA
jgi:hypothetical protein